MSLLQFAKKMRSKNDPMLLATLVKTGGSTFRKPGARMLFASSGTSAGHISAGCVEKQIKMHGTDVLAADQPQLYLYDFTHSMDYLIGSGTGCRGKMHIFLEPIVADILESDLEVMLGVAAAKRRSALCIAGEGIGGRAWFDSKYGVQSNRLNEATVRELSQYLTQFDSEPTTVDINGNEFFLESHIPPIQILGIGASPVCEPLAQIATALDWSFTLIDPRQEPLEQVNLPPSCSKCRAAPAEFATFLKCPDATAVVLMTHHFEWDLKFLPFIARGRPGYLGVLGPDHRWERLLAESSVDLPFEDRLWLEKHTRSPAGIVLRGDGPGVIALSLSAQIQQELNIRCAY